MILEAFDKPVVAICSAFDTGFAGGVWCLFENRQSTAGQVLIGDSGNALPFNQIRWDNNFARAVVCFP